jgi:hypothetical protein
LVINGVPKTRLSLFVPMGRSLALATRDTVLKGFPDVIDTADVQDLGDGFDRAYKGAGFTISIEKNGVGPGG